MNEGGLGDGLLARPVFGDWCVIAAETPGRFSGTLTFRTSGTFGAPKCCPHALVDLQREVGALAAILSGSKPRVLTAVPCHHIYGFLFTVLLPQRLGGVPVLDIRGHSPPHFRGSRSPATWLSVTRSSGRLRRLRRQQPGPPARPPGTAPAAIMAPDKLEWLDERRYRVGARDDGAVQVGGINVFPNRVRSVLQEHPDIAAAAVRLMSPAEGRRLKAFIVPALAGTDIDALRNGLDAWVAKRLSGPERPRAYTFGRSLPADQMGKAAEWPVTADAA